MLRVLVQVLGCDSVAARRRLARQRDVSFEHLVGVAADFYVRAIAVKSLDPVRHPWAVMMRIVAIAAT